MRRAVDAPMYASHPGADDIVRARVRTLGVEEHHFTMENGASLATSAPVSSTALPCMPLTAPAAPSSATPSSICHVACSSHDVPPGALPGTEWYIYDVGGGRSCVRFPHRYCAPV